MKYLLCLALIVAVSAVRADDPHNAKPLQGAWTVAKAELGGQALPAEILKSISLTLGDGTYEVLVAGEPDRGTFTLDASATPKTMDIIGTEGPNKGKTLLAIYELDGDTVRVCYDLSGAKRPAEFKSAAGTMLYLATYQRKK